MAFQKNAWSEDNLSTVRRMWEEGKTASEISKVIGKTRSAVLGKVRRLDLARRPATAPAISNKKKEVEFEIKKQRPKKYKPTEEKERISNTSFGKKCSLLDLKNNQCRWPIGDPKNQDFGFCGAKASGSYCAEHKSLAYTGLAKTPFIPKAPIYKSL